MNHQLWFVDSRDRVMGSNEDFYIEPRSRLPDVSSVGVREIEIPFSWNVFLTTHKINFKEGAGAQLTATLTAGNYTSTELIAHLKAIMDAAVGAGLTYTWAYNNITGLLTCSATGIFTFLWASGTNAGNGLDQLLGYTEAGGTASDTTSATPHIATYKANFSGENALYLEVTPLSSGNSKQMSIINNLPRPVLCKIPIDVSPGGIIIYNPSEMYVAMTRADIDRLRFRLVDRLNTSINLRGREMSLTLDLNY